jgi:hypothetical protein
MTETTTKVCKECGMEYPKTAEYFHARNRGEHRATEYNCRCKPCHQQYLRDHRKKYSNSFNISPTSPSRRKKKKAFIPTDSVWAIALHLRLIDEVVVRPIVTGPYEELRSVFDTTPNPSPREYDGATEVWVALEPAGVGV